MARSTDCELWANKRWELIDIELAVRMPKGRFMRCVECHGRVRAHALGKTGQAAHFEHFERHKGCSRGDCFDGDPRMHHRTMA